ncbi:hypothetical protein DFQ04_2170 [Algoriphagus boseongensis]|uniref:Uncharacterized protein n=1 Tax=Algoriphagus boseongensis TaxID=1442587 RepID=A0A4R6T7G4_9BACT|nr:hypothetical protein [Algoriphagus boseongensis]TDQ17516.1 hypothetical protein DFQ04_2170 [Algoriphagus boseongensis]
MSWFQNLKSWFLSWFGSPSTQPQKASVEPTPAVEISRQPGLNCPECSTRLVVSIQNLVNLDPVMCPNCGLELMIDVEKSQSAIDSLRKLQSGLDEASRVKENSGY